MLMLILITIDVKPPICSLHFHVLLVWLLIVFRYMSVDVVHDGPERVLLALACSDGAVRWVSLSEAVCC